MHALSRAGAIASAALCAAAFAALTAAPAGAKSKSIDCTGSNAACPSLEIAGDPPASGPVRGYADPSLRRDPKKKRIWMAYSRPYELTSGAQPGVHVDNHLAYSDDKGRTWTFDRTLWTSFATTDPVNGAPAYSNSETVALEPHGHGHGHGRSKNKKAKVDWYSVHQRYVSDVGAGAPRISTFHLMVTKASSPRKLAGAEQDEQSLGGGATSPTIPVDFNLSQLSSELAGCVFRDAGLHFEHHRLYLAAECSLFPPGGEDFANGFIAVFSTKPKGSPQSWSWRYEGKLTDHADALALGGDDLEQTDLSEARDGKLLAILSPGQEGTTILGAHLGCRALEVKSLDPPRLRRTSTGAPKLAATVTASDLAPNGPGACGYAADSRTGIVIMRRLVGAGQGLVGTLNATGLRP